MVLRDSATPTADLFKGRVLWWSCGSYVPEQAPQGAMDHGLGWSRWPYGQEEQHDFVFIPDFPQKAGIFPQNARFFRKFIETRWKILRYNRSDVSHVGPRPILSSAVPGLFNLVATQA